MPGSFGPTCDPLPLCPVVEKNATVRDRRWPIHWVWLPIAVVVAVIGWRRFGWETLFLVALGLGIGVYGEWAARRRPAG